MKINPLILERIRSTHGDDITTRIEAYIEFHQNLSDREQTNLLHCLTVLGSLPKHTEPSFFWEDGSPTIEVQFDTSPDMYSTVVWFKDTSIIVVDDHQEYQYSTAKAFRDEYLTMHHLI